MRIKSIVIYELSKDIEEVLKASPCTAYSIAALKTARAVVEAKEIEKTMDMVREGLEGL